MIPDEALGPPGGEAMAAGAHSRVLMLCATRRDARMTADLLGRAGIHALDCPDMAAAVREMAAGAGALLVAEEMLEASETELLTQALAAQEPWSDLPVLLLAWPGAASTSVDQAMHALANVTVIERPVRVASLVSVVRAALRARARQLDLRDLLQNLRQVDRRRIEFLATLAHELRNPMAPLTTTLALLERTRPTPAEAQPHYVVMARQLDHMGRLIDDLMEMSRLTRGKISLQPGLLALDEVLRDAVELSRPMLSARRQVLCLGAVPPGLDVHGDGVRLAQVFANLLNNAAKYTPPGGHIGIEVHQLDDMARVTVRDDGSGIPPEMLDSIFDMFVQVSDTARAAQGGLGIGLTLVRKLVELHGGRVVARSEGLGRGSEFEVLLPLASASAACAEATHDASQPLCGVGRVLVVDDNHDAADSLAALLELLGAETSVAYGGVQALEVADSTRPAFAILDIGMPGMDGWQLAARLRADPALAGLVLIALSGWKTDDDPPRAAGAAARGFDHHLMKPPNIERLIAVLTGAVVPAASVVASPASAAQARSAPLPPPA
jgi:signal transduction histidine kinase/ActR/RegA family two-component response regulator